MPINTPSQQFQVDYSAPRVVTGVKGGLQGWPSIARYWCLLLSSGAARLPCFLCVLLLAIKQAECNTPPKKIDKDTCLVERVPAI